MLNKGTTINILLRLMLIFLVFGIFTIHQISLVLLISRRATTEQYEWAVITLLLVLCPYMVSLLAQVWKSSILARGKWKEWPALESLLLGCLSAVAESFILINLIWNVLYKIPEYMLPGILNSTMIFSMIFSGNSTRPYIRYLQKILTTIFVCCFLTSGIMLSVTEHMSANGSQLFVVYVVIISIIRTPKFQHYLHTTKNKGSQNSALLYSVLKIFTALIVIIALHDEDRSKDYFKSVQDFFLSIKIPQKTEGYLCVCIVLSSLLGQVIKYFNPSSIKTNWNIFLPIYLSTIVTSILVVLVLVGNLEFFSWTESLTKKSLDISPSKSDIICYIITINLLIIPIFIQFLSEGNSDFHMCNGSFNSVFALQYLSSAALKSDFDCINPNTLKLKRRLFICTTMYQESNEEMCRFSESLKNVSVSNLLQEENVSLESHIFLDNGAIGEKVQPFGLQLLALIEEHLITDSKNGVMLFTPYGIQFFFLMGNGIPLFVHLKDVSKVKAKKRWSQVMYMTYVLRYCSARIPLYSDVNTASAFVENSTNDSNGATTHISFVKLPVEKHNITNSKSTMITMETEDITVNEHSTHDYILATDADIFFSESSFMDVLRVCESDPSVGAVCGRTHPEGMHLHPIVWLQMFDYAKDFWLMKSSQNIIGSVMCCPGCFSLYRLEALRDIIEEYCSPADNIEDVFTKDTGEDRWLCTLMMLKGWKLRYCSSARNTTFCPEDTAELMKQRRRWILSDYAHAILVIKNLRSLVSTNDAFSFLYVVYLLEFFLSMMIYPGLAILVMCFGLELTSGTRLVISVPVTVTIFVIYPCLLLYNRSSTVQLIATKMLIIIFGAGSIYVFVSSTIIGFSDLFKDFQNENDVNAVGVFALIAVGSYMYGALLYPFDAWILITGVVYLFFLPFVHIILPSYAFCKIVDQSWGTRENERPVLPKYLRFPKIKRKIKRCKHSYQGKQIPDIMKRDTQLVRNLSRSYLNIQDYNQSEYEFWEEAVSSTIGTNVSVGISVEERQPGLQKLRKNSLVIFFCSNVIFIATIVGFYEYSNQIYRSLNIFSIIIWVTLGLPFIIHIIGSTVYRIDDILTRIGRSISSIYI